MCDDCLAELDVMLDAFPDLWEQLQLVVTRQTVYSGKSPGRASDTPMVFNSYASDVSHQITNTLSTWVRLILDEHACPTSRPHVIDETLVDWLRDQLTWLARRREGAEAVTDMVEDLSRIHSVIDSPPQQSYLGPCPSCSHALYVTMRQTHIECRACGAFHNVEQLQQRALREAHDRLAHASLVCRALVGLGVTVDHRQISRWVDKRRLFAKGHDQLGRPVYRIGDVIDLAAQELARRRA